ncbi:MAG: hypothetical protein L0206_00655 [Actinobacteria bacterium]|nr:hypothetical protein [Actinomycetota bacterium]
MNEGPKGEVPAGADASEVERLRAERDELRAEVESVKARPERRHRVRRVLAPLFVALTILVFTVTVPAAWGARTVLNTDRYVTTVAPLASDPAVQRSLATRVTDQVFVALNLEGVLQERLPSELAFIAAPLTNAVRGFVQDQVLKVVQSDAFATFWTEANRFVHTQVLAILRGEGETVSVVEGKVLLNLMPLVNLAIGSIQTVASDLVGRSITLPAIEPDEVPQESIAKLESALGVDLPEDYGTLAVYDAEELGALQKALDLFQRLLILLLVLIPILGGLALWLSMRKRRTLIQLTVGGAIGLVLVRRLAIAGRGSLYEQVDVERFPSVRVLTDELMASLFRYTTILLAIVLVTLLIALVTGPYPWAVALRSWVRDLGRGIGATLRGEQAETERIRWLREHRDAVMIAVAILGVAILFFFDLSLWGTLIVLVLVGLLELAVFRLGRAEELEEVGTAA